MAKTSIKIIIAVLPLMLVLGFIRISIALTTSTEIPFLPTPTELINMFETMPNFMDLANEDIKNITNIWNNTNTNFKAFTTTDEVASYWNSITDLTSFFKAIGDTFNWLGTQLTELFKSLGSYFVAIGNIFKLLFDLISIPIRFISWFFYNILGFNLIYRN